MENLNKSTFRDVSLTRPSFRYVWLIAKASSLEEKKDREQQLRERTVRFGEKVVKTSGVTAIKESPGFNYTDPALLYLPLPNTAAQWWERDH